MKILSQKEQIYKNITTFQGLNALRFIAAFLVVMHHSEAIRHKNGIENFEWLGLFRNGGNAVTFFFVLSGFLITFLLLKERDRTGNIKVKTFYLKRILRIWPLYYLLVIIGTLALPFAFSILQVDYEMPYTLKQTWLYFVLFVPGLVTFFWGHHFLEPLWSIGVEEVFYLIWAPLFKISKNRIFQLLVSVILIKSLLSVSGILIINNELFNYLVNSFKFEAMAIGGLGAYFLYSRNTPVSQLLIFKIPFQIIVFSTVIFYLTLHTNVDTPIWNAIFKTPILSALVIEFLFLYIIVCISCADNSIIRLKSKTLSFLGEISYGIYMYHMLVIFATIFLLKKFLIDLCSPWSHLVFYCVITVFTIAVSIVSKQLFENYFLKLKEKL